MSTKGKGQSSQKALNSSGNKKKVDSKGKGNEKAQGSANVWDISDLPTLSVTSSKSINFSCYETGETVEWSLDSGCTDHITPRKSDFVQYRELGQLHKAEIADGKYLKIEGYGTVIGHSIKMSQCRSEMCYMFQRWISSFFNWLLLDSVEVCPKQWKTVQ